MAVTRFTGKDMVVHLETSDANMVELPFVTEVRVSDGEADKVEFEGGDWVQVGHGLAVYWVEVDFELDLDTETSSGSWYVAMQVDRKAASLDDTPRLIHFYPYGTTAGYAYFQQDSIFEVRAQPLNKRSGKGMGLLRADPHVQSSTEPGWTDAAAAS